MFFYGCYYKNKLTPYSQKFKSKKKAKEWYKNYGIGLCRLFKRELVLKERKDYRNQKK